MSQPIQINRQAVQADIDVFQVKIEMQKAVIEAHHEKAKHDRLLVKAILDGLFSTDRIVSYHSWATAHKKEEEAHSAILQFDLMQMESQVQIREAMLREGDKNVVEPGGFRA